MCRRIIILAAILLAIFVGCGDPPRSIVSDGDGGFSVDSNTPGGLFLAEQFQVVGSEEVHLNGVENDGRPPISFFLIAGADAELQDQGEIRLVQAYVHELTKAGWVIEPFTTDVDWWTFYGHRGKESIRIGPSERFSELARAAEGMARVTFRATIASSNVPLVVVSIDPQS